MKRFLIVFLVLLLALPGHAAHILFNLKDFVQNPLVVKQVKLSPNDAPGVNETNIITRDTVTKQTSTGGQVTFSNVVAGNYKVDVIGPNLLSTFNITVTNTSSTINAADITTVSTNAPSAVHAYSMDTSDGRFLRQIIYTNSTPAGTNAFLNIVYGTNMAIRTTNNTTTGRTDVYISSSASGGGGGGGEANTSSNQGDGVGIASEKSGVDLPFKSLKTGPGSGTWTSNATTATLTLPAALTNLLQAAPITNLVVDPTQLRWNGSTLGLTNGVKTTNAVLWFSSEPGAPATNQFTLTGVQVGAGISPTFANVSRYGDVLDIFTARADATASISNILYFSLNSRFFAMDFKLHGKNDGNTDPRYVWNFMTDNGITQEAGAYLRQYAVNSVGIEFYNPDHVGPMYAIRNTNNIMQFGNHTYYQEQLGLTYSNSAPSTFTSWLRVNGAVTNGGVFTNAGAAYFGSHVTHHGATTNNSTVTNAGAVYNGSHTTTHGAVSNLSTLRQVGLLTALAGANVAGAVNLTNTLRVEGATDLRSTVNIPLLTSALLGVDADGLVQEDTAGTADIDNDAVTYAKIQNVSAASKLLGRGSAAGAGDVEEITLGTGLTMSGTTLSSSGGTAAQKEYFIPEDAQFQSTNFPAISIVNGTVFPVSGLAFDASTEERAYWRFFAHTYTSGNLTLKIRWYADNASSGNVVWQARIAAITPDTDSQDVETKAFASYNFVQDTHLGTTGQRVHTCTITISNLDSLAQGDEVWIDISRDADGTNATDDLANDAILISATLELP